MNAAAAFTGLPGMPTPLPAQVSFVALFVYAWFSGRRSRGLHSHLLLTLTVGTETYDYTFHDYNVKAVFRIKKKNQFLTAPFTCVLSATHCNIPSITPICSTFLPRRSFLHILTASADVPIFPLSLLLFNPSCLLSSAPPSAPVSLSWEYESGDGGVSLRWRHPVDMGGRSEVWYGIVCRICPSATVANPASCSWCGEGVTFSPSQTNLKQTKVTLNNLLTRVTYLIQVPAWIWVFSRQTPPSAKCRLFDNQLLEKVNITSLLI